MLTSTSNYQEDLVSAGSDAYSNLYQIEFGGALDTEGEALTIRANGINIPPFKQDSYTVRFMNEYVDFPRAQSNVTRSFQITFRIDSNYKEYKALIAQMNKTFKPTSSLTVTNLFEIEEKNLFYVKVTVITPDGNVDLFKFDRCWITSISSPNYKNNSSDPLTATVSINYIGFTDLSTTNEGTASSLATALGITSKGTS